MQTDIHRAYVRIVRRIVYLDVVSSRQAVPAIRAFLDMLWSELDDDGATQEQPWAFFRAPWRKEPFPADGVIRRLRESRDKTLVALTTSIESVDQMIGLARRANEDGAKTCIVFTAQCHFTAEDFQAIEKSEIDILFLTSVPNYGAPFQCSKVVCITSPNGSRAKFEAGPLVCGNVSCS